MILTTPDPGCIARDAASLDDWLLRLAGPMP
jgi:hypothetical protein